MERVRVTKPKPYKLGDDLLYSAREIADYLGMKPRQVYHWIEAKGLPVRRFGPHSFTARKSELDRWFSAKENRS